MANKKKKNQSNQRREKKRKKKEIKRKEKIHHRTHDYSWKGYTRNQQEVAMRIKAGDYEMITGTGWGFLDKFFVFLFSIGFFSSLEIEGKGFERVMIPLAQLFMNYELKILLGINSVDKMTKHLFRDTALLMLIGFTARQIGEGFCNRDKGKREGPMIPDTVGDALSKLPCLCRHGRDEYDDEQHTKNINRKDFKANPVNAVMVTRWKGEDYKPGREKVFITSLSVKYPYDIIKLYNLRTLIENLAFRELKQGWLLTSYPQKTENAVCAHVLLTLVMFSAVNAYRSDLGQKLAEKGIRRWRYENASSIHKVVIFAEDYYAIFDIEEVMALVGRPPKRFLRITPEKIQT